MNDKTTKRGDEAVSDELYGVVSVLYHALQGAQAYATYSDDARRGGDEELVEFFESCRSEDNERAREAKQLLAERLDSLDDGDEDEREGTEETARGRDDGEDARPSNGPAGNPGDDDEEEDYQATPSRDERISGR